MGVAVNVSVPSVVALMKSVWLLIPTAYASPIRAGLPAAFSDSTSHAEAPTLATDSITVAYTPPCTRPTIWYSRSVTGSRATTLLPETSTSSVPTRSSNGLETGGGWFTAYSLDNTGHHAW